MQSSETCKLPNPSLGNIEKAKKDAENLKYIINNNDNIPEEKRKNAIADIDRSITTLNNPSGYNRKILSFIVWVFLAIATSLANSTMLTEEEAYKSIALAENSMLSENYFGHCMNIANYQTFNGLYNIIPYLNIPVNKKDKMVSLGQYYEDVLSTWNERLPYTAHLDKSRSLNNIKFINYFSDDVNLPNNGYNSELNPNFLVGNEIQLKDLMISLKNRHPSQMNDVDLTKKMTTMIRKNLDAHFIPLTQPTLEILMQDKIYTVPLMIRSIAIDSYLHNKTVEDSRSHALVLYMRLIDGKLKYGIMDIQNLYGTWNKFQSFSKNGRFDGNPIGIFEPGFWKEGDLFYEKLSGKLVKFDDPFFYLIKQWSIDKYNNPQYPSIIVDYNIKTLISPPVVTTLENFIAYTYKLGQAYSEAIDLKYISEKKIRSAIYYSNAFESFKWVFKHKPKDNVPPDEFRYELIKWYAENKKEILSIAEIDENKQLGKKLKDIIPIRILLKEKYTELYIKLKKLDIVRAGTERLSMKYREELDKVFRKAYSVYLEASNYINRPDTALDILKKSCKDVIEQIEIVNTYIPPDPDWKISTICKLITSWLFPVNNMLRSYFVSDYLNEKYKKDELIKSFYADYVSANKDADIEEEQAKSVSPIFEEPKPSWFQTTRKNWLGWGGRRRKRNRRTYKRKYKLKRK